MALPAVQSRINVSNGQQLDQLSGLGLDILADTTITASGESDIYNCVGANSINLSILVAGFVTGTNPTLKFEIVPVLVNTETGASVPIAAIIPETPYTGASISTGLGTTDAITVGQNYLPDYFYITWTTGGTNPSFGNVYARVNMRK